MGLEEGMPLDDIDIQMYLSVHVQMRRLSDLRAAAKVIEGKKVHPTVTAIVVPGSRTVKKQAETKASTKFSLKQDLNGENQAAVCAWR